jgi:transposase
MNLIHRTSSADLGTTMEEGVHHELKLVERCFNKLKRFRHIATRYDKLGPNFFAFIQLASIRIFFHQFIAPPVSIASP